MKKQPQTGVRVSKDTLAKIKVMAQADNRSMTNWLETLIDREYKNMEGNSMNSVGYAYYIKEGTDYKKMEKSKQDFLVSGPYSCIEEKLISNSEEFQIFECKMEMTGMSKRLREQGKEQYQGWKDTEIVYRIVTDINYSLPEKI